MAKETCNCFLLIAFCQLIGAPAGIRTPNQQIMSPAEGDPPETLDKREHTSFATILIHIDLIIARWRAEQKRALFVGTACKPSAENSTSPNPIQRNSHTRQRRLSTLRDD